MLKSEWPKKTLIRNKIEKLRQDSLHKLKPLFQSLDQIQLSYYPLSYYPYSLEGYELVLTKIKIF